MNAAGAGRSSIAKTARIAKLDQRGRWLHSGGMSTLRTYAQLCRLPAVFTAMADILMGWFVRQETADVIDPVRLLALIVASSGLYLAGMVLNDIFDRQIDARERPGRPIPSGRVSLARAATFAAMLIAAGLVAAQVAGFKSVLVALILLVNILVYDFWAKHTPAGPVAMGSCRFLNVLLGGSVGAMDFAHVFTSPLVIVAVGMGVYVAGVTWFAKKEAEVSSRSGLVLGQSVMNLGLVVLAAWMAPPMQPVWQSLGWWFTLPSTEAWRPLMMLGVVAVVVNRRALAAMFDPRAPVVQSAVRIMLLSIITLDATLIYAALGTPGTAVAIGVVGLLLPSFVLGKWMSMT
jgi:4-hydroxybenzoate polyprenyltransferase